MQSIKSLEDQIFHLKCLWERTGDSKALSKMNQLKKQLSKAKKQR